MYFFKNKMNDVEDINKVRKFLLDEKKKLEFRNVKNKLLKEEYRIVSKLLDLIDSQSDEIKDIAIDYKISFIYARNEGNGIVNKSLILYEVLLKDLSNDLEAIKDDWYLKDDFCRAIYFLKDKIIDYQFEESRRRSGNINNPKITKKSRDMFERGKYEKDDVDLYKCYIKFKRAEVNDNFEEDLFLKQFSILKKPLDILQNQLSNPDLELSNDQRNSIKNKIVHYVLVLKNDEEYFTFKDSLKTKSNKDFEQIKDVTEKYFDVMQSIGFEIQNIIDLGVSDEISLEGYVIVGSGVSR